MRLALLLLPLALLGASACDAQEAIAKGCGRHQATVSEAAAARPLPQLTGRVIDLADLLTPSVEQRLAGQLEALEAETTDQFVVLTVPSLDGEAIEHFALRAGNGWGIGRDDLDNGVLLIVAPAERKARIEVGCGLEGLLTDETAQKIMNEQMVPRFASGEFEKGIDAGAAAVTTVLRSHTERPRPWKKAGTS